MLSLTALRQQAHAIEDISPLVGKMQQDIKDSIEASKDELMLAHYLQLSNVCTKLQMHQHTTERLHSLVNGIGQVRAAIVTDDKKQLVSVIQKQTKDDRLSALIEKSRNMRGDIRHLKSFEDTFGQIPPIIQKLKQIQQQQYSLLKEGSLKFLELSHKGLQ